MDSMAWYRRKIYICRSKEQLRRRTEEKDIEARYS
jgi:hypothetical protein